MKAKMVAAAAAMWLAMPAAAAPVNEFAWLGGAWVSEEGERWTEEHWLVPRGGVMVGVNRSGTGERFGGFEYMRIAEDANGVVSFWASPSGKPASAFPLVSAKPGEVVFENPAHDYPTRIVYRRAGEELLATISGAGGANAMSWRFRRPRLNLDRHPELVSGSNCPRAAKLDDGR